MEIQSSVYLALTKMNKRKLLASLVLQLITVTHMLFTVYLESINVTNALLVTSVLMLPQYHSNAS